MKFQLMILCGFRAIGLEVKVAQKESDFEQQTLGFFFEGFRPSKEVIIFLRIPYHVDVYAGIFIWILG